ncbi:MAG TPA: zinc-binding dehydrogenase, partial [Anaerolineaceae bacterium]
EAAALPLTALTAWEAFADRLGILPHAPAGGAAKSVLIIGGAGGVGSIATQLAKRVFGLRVIATAGREESAAWCRQMGADLIADRRLPLKAALEQAGAGKVEYILCLNSTEVYLPQMADVIQPQGRICSIVRAKDNQPLPLNLFFDLSVSFSWEYMFTRPVRQTPDMHAQHAILAEVSRLVDAGVLRTTMRESLGVLGPETLRTAHQRLEAGETIGKLTLSGM